MPFPLKDSTLNAVKYVENVVQDRAIGLECFKTGGGGGGGVNEWVT